MNKEDNFIVETAKKNLNQIDTDKFIDDITQCCDDNINVIEITNTFCNLIKSVKDKTIKDIMSDLSMSSNVNSLVNETKNLIKNSKIKIKNLENSINDMATQLNVLRDYVKKGKMNNSLDKIEKLFTIKSEMMLNLKSIIELNDKFKEENKKNSNNASLSPVIRKKSPITKTKSTFIMYNTTGNALMNSKNVNNIHKVQNKSLNRSKNKKSFNTIAMSSDISNDSSLRNILENDSKIEIAELKQRISELTANNDKLQNEIKLLKTQLKQSSNRESGSNVMMEMNSNLSKITDSIFQLTFSINNNVVTDINTKEIKQSLIDVTSTISEIKSTLLQLSFKPQTKTPSVEASELKELKDENSMLKTEITNLKEEIIEQKEQIDMMTTKLNSNNYISKENIENYIKHLSNNSSFTEGATTTTSNNEINLLKDQLRNSQRDLMELKEIYNSDIESKSLIENILKKDISDTKKQYEMKIAKLKETVSQKEKEMNELKEHYQNEEIAILTQIKENNKKNIQQLKSLYDANIAAKENIIEKQNAMLQKMKIENETNAKRDKYKEDSESDNESELLKEEIEKISKEKNEIESRYEMLSNEYSQYKTNCINFRRFYQNIFYILSHGYRELEDLRI